MHGPEQPAKRNVSPFAQLLTRAKCEGRPDTHFGKRRHPRFELGATLVASTRLADLDVAWSVVMKNISKSGLAILSERPMTQGRTIYLNDTPAPTAESWVSGEIMHCTPTDEGYLIGVALDDDSSSRERHVENRLC